MRAKPASGFTTPDDASIALRARPYRPEASFLLKTSASVFYVFFFFPPLDGVFVAKMMNKFE